MELHVNKMLVIAPTTQTNIHVDVFIIFFVTTRHVTTGFDSNKTSEESVAEYRPNSDSHVNVTFTVMHEILNL